MDPFVRECDFWLEQLDAYPWNYSLIHSFIHSFMIMNSASEVGPNQTILYQPRPRPSIFHSIGKPNFIISTKFHISVKISIIWWSHCCLCKKNPENWYLSALYIHLTMMMMLPTGGKNVAWMSAGLLMVCAVVCWNSFFLANSNPQELRQKLQEVGNRPPSDLYSSWGGNEKKVKNQTN